MSKKIYRKIKLKKIDLDKLDTKEKRRNYSRREIQRILKIFVKKVNDARKQSVFLIDNLDEIKDDLIEKILDNLTFDIDNDIRHYEFRFNDISDTTKDIEEFYNNFLDEKYNKRREVLKKANLKNDSIIGMNTKEIHEILKEKGIDEKNFFIG